MAFWSALSPVTPPVRPSRFLFFMLVGAFLLTLIPHVAQLPTWITACVVLAMVVRGFLEYYRIPLPSTLFCSLMAICLLFGIYLQYNTVLGRDAGTAFTAGLLAIKFYELRGARDVALIIFSCFFVVMSSLLYSQVIELFIYCLIMMWVLTALLLRVQMGDQPPDRLLQMLQRSGLVFMQALPLALFLFFFFPRFNGSLRIPLNESSLGIPNQISPGSIASLSDNDDPAMYVRFTSFTPSPTEMYWRALLLWDYHNGVWTQGAYGNSPGALPKPAAHPELVVQEITIWPHFQRWLFALDYPVLPPSQISGVPEATENIYGGIIRLTRALDHKERYTVTSSTHLAEQSPTPGELAAAIRLPYDEIDPRIRQLSDQLWASAPDEQGYISAVLRFFQHGHFSYSATPGAEPPGHEKEWLAHFLFERKSGFCEHYASAFGVLLRLRKIPTRLVAGYVGGEYNPYDNSYKILQSNAHAWNEVWIESKKQWVRYDPTALITAVESRPLASQGGSDSNSTDSLSVQMAKNGFFSKDSLPGWMRSALTEIQLRRDQIESDWDDWVFSYDPTAQSKLAQALGLGEKSQTWLFIGCVVAVISCAFIFRRFIRQKTVEAPVEQLYTQFCRAMAQRGILRSLWEGPLDYTQRAAAAFPEKGTEIQHVGQIVARSRYGRLPADPAAPEELKSLLTLITASQAASSSRES